MGYKKGDSVGEPIRDYEAWWSEAEEKLHKERKRAEKAEARLKELEESGLSVKRVLDPKDRHWMINRVEAPEATYLITHGGVEQGSPVIVNVLPTPEYLGNCAREILKALEENCET